MAFHPSDPSGRPPSGQASDPAAPSGERIARALARAGVSSRREAERMIAAGRVALNGRVLDSPAVNVARNDILTVDGKVVAEREPARLWRYHKPAGLITSHTDPKGRKTVFDHLPKGLPRVISVGRLDIASEGLLLLTNDGGLARELELPTTALVRRYRARAFGRAGQDALDRLKDGVVVDGVAYGPIEAKLERGAGSNVWIAVSIAEGKNREVRKVLESIGMKVNRLIRVAYGPFDLGDLPAGEVDEVPSRLVKQLQAGEALTMPPSGARVSASRSSATRKPADAGGAPSKRSKAGLGPKRAAPAEEKKPKPVYKAGWARPKPRIKPAAAKVKPRRT